MSAVGAAVLGVVALDETSEEYCCECIVCRAEAAVVVVF